ncbi:MAG: hypothetical protein ACXWZS_17235, partial [Gemmatirosa sp.]
ADAVVIVTDHRAIDWQFVIDHAAVVVDTRNAVAKLRPGRARIVALSTSRTDAATATAAANGNGAALPAGTVRTPVAH